VCASLNLYIFLATFWQLLSHLLDSTPDGHLHSTLAVAAAEQAMAALADLTGLPEAVLDIVTASLPGHSHRWALLSSCRAGRDAVLRSIDTISLNYRQQAGQQKHKLKRSGPMGRFLHRACQLARPGLHVKLDNSADILKELLRPALDSTQPNANVHDLEVRLSDLSVAECTGLAPKTQRSDKQGPCCGLDSKTHCCSWPC
jgi:hypothetical protein